ncbi:MAG TPA: GNAT family N-acetyltransferase [Solirubrobacterales bacterium]|jgi:ribosomal protein S18 acetylase RimI-like enzyme
MEIVRYRREHLEPILKMADGVAFPSLVEDPERAHRSLSSPGSITLVALEDGEPVGFAHTITDGAIQAYLCRLLVAPERQRRGIGRALADRSLADSGAIRVDLLSSEEAEPLYRRFPHERWPGYRLFPEEPPGEG